MAVLGDKLSEVFSLLLQLIHSIPLKNFSQGIGVFAPADETIEKIV